MAENLLFCPTCCNILQIGQNNDGRLQFGCLTCPYVYKVHRKQKFKTRPPRKPVQDVLGGADAWKNVDSTAAECGKCGHDRAFFMQIQIRSADEPSTTFFRCCECHYNWRDD